MSGTGRDAFDVWNSFPTSQSKDTRYPIFRTRFRGSLTDLCLILVSHFVQAMDSPFSTCRLIYRLGSFDSGVTRRYWLLFELTLEWLESSHSISCSSLCAQD